MATPTETALTRVSKSDFFAILGSGIYVVGSYSLLVGALFSQRSSASDDLRWLTGIVEKHWSVAAGLLYLSFLVGSVLRALRVNVVDSLYHQWVGSLRRLLYRSRFWPQENLPTFSWVGRTWLIFARWRRNQNVLRQRYDRALRRGGFPYRGLLLMESKALKKNVPELDFSLPEKGTRHLLFNLKNAPRTT